jgi:hypothetical protein
MNSGASNSGRVSGTTSNSEQPHAGNGREADLLAREAAAAQAAVLGVLNDLKSGLTTAADPRAWAQQHPWVAVGASAAAGFAAAAMFVPSRDQKLKDKFSDLLSAVAPAPHHQPGSNGDAKVEPRSGGSSAMAMLMEPLIDVAKTAITSFVIGAVHKSADDAQAAPRPAAPAPEEEYPDAAYPGYEQAAPGADAL